MNDPVSQSQSPAVVFESYFGPSLFRPWGEALLRRVDLRPDDRVLDLACATGTVARLVAETGSDAAEVHGLDSSAAMLEVARGAAADAGLAI
ncbi:MAG: class I SAM-dependent methyltransferase, partial [Gaiellales bacterium]